jgi:hypothetical protein
VNVPRRLFKLSEGKCCIGGPACPWPKRESGPLNLSNLQSGRAVWSRPSPDAASGRYPKKGEFPMKNFQTYRGEVQFGGLRQGPKRESEVLTSPTYRVGKQCGAARHRTRQAPKSRKFGRIPGGDLINFQRGSAVRALRALVPREIRAPGLLQLTERGSSVEPPRHRDAQ